MLGEAPSLVNAGVPSLLSTKKRTYPSSYSDEDVPEGNHISCDMYLLSNLGNMG